MLCPKRKYTEHEVPIEHNDALRIEALTFEINVRFLVLSYVKEHHVEIPAELSERYRAEYFGFCIDLEKALSDCARKYLKELRGSVPYKVDYEKCVIIWAEAVEEDEKAD